MPHFGKCSGCNVLHLAPFGFRCRYGLEAKAYCRTNNIPEKEFLTYVDYNSMPKYSATDEIAPELDDLDISDHEQKPTETKPSASPSWINDPIRINHEQRQQVDNLISKFDKLVTLVQAPAVQNIGAVGQIAGANGGQTGIIPETDEGVKLSRNQNLREASGFPEIYVLTNPKEPPDPP